MVRARPVNSEGRHDRSASDVRKGLAADGVGARPQHRPDGPPRQSGGGRHRPGAPPDDRLTAVIPVVRDAPPAHLPITLQPESDASQLAGTVAVCIDNEPAILDGMEALLGGWGCRVLKAPDLSTALVAAEASRPHLSGLLVDYHLDDGNGIDAIVQLRHRVNNELPAILITADRTLRVRDAARARDVPVLHKPVKPAALRVLLAQWRLQNIAAAE